MKLDKKLLPSISMLAAFDATARHGSFSRAAAELNVTHGAVSRQIRALEHQLNVALFDRTAQGVALTDVGERYAPDVRSILEKLSSASLEIITDPKGCTINLAILPTFGTRWLIPRLPDFLDRNPDITVNFVTRNPQVRLEEDGIDAAIHNSEPDWPGVESTFLLGGHSYPVCSPALSRRLGGQLRPENPDLPLLGLKTRPDAWQNWFTEGDLDIRHDDDTMVFEYFSGLAHAAVAGIGVALLPRFLISKELEQGSLIVLSSRPTVAEMSYYFCTPIAKQNYEPVRLLRRWLLKAVEREIGDGSEYSIAPANELGTGTSAKH